MLFSSCSDSDSSLLKKENLFSLRYGRMDDQLDMSSRKSASITFPALIKMANGIIYIMNGNLLKIMKFTSYGDLLAVLGKKDRNSEPVLVEEDVHENERVNRKAVFFPFNNIEEFAVDQRQYIIVSDLLPPERREWDEKSGALLSNIIYRFDNNCNFIDFLGQDGKGGMPFPYIKNIITNADNDVIAVTLSNLKKIVYWFNSKGELLYKIELDNNSIPLPSGESSYNASIDTIKAPESGHLLYIKTDYYEKNINEATGTQNDIDFYKSYINVLDIQSGRYTKMIEIPDVYTSPDLQSNIMEKRLQVLYKFLDIIDNKYIYLSSIINNKTMQILILETDGSVAGQTRINIDFESYYHIDIDLSSKGILTALLAGDTETNIAWWRSDLLLRENK